MKKANKKESKFSYYFLLFVISLYLILALFDTQNVMSSLQKSSVIFFTILPIVIAVLLITALMNHFIHPKTISKHIGQNSGIKGWFFSIGAGVMSHGSTFIWYPLFQELREHGARDALVITFFFTRTIKLPWLPMMISYFGVSFTIIFTFYILVAALMQGLVYEKFFQKNSPTDES